MKIFVIGSNSFSGSNFVDFALNNGFLVFGISRSVPPNNVFLKYSENNIKVQNFKFYQLDLNNNLDEIGTTNIVFNKNRNWKEKIFVDEKTNKIYTIFKKAGISRLYEINKQTGKLGKSTEIPNFKWINKIIIYDGIIYFMYRKNSTLELMRLFKLPID